MTFVTLPTRGPPPQNYIVLTISKRLQMQLIAFVYATLSLYAVYQWHLRHLAELQNPIDASGGMWAFGDEILNLFLFCLFLVPTFFLLRFMAQEDRVFVVYCKLALVVTLTAPLFTAMLMIFHPLPRMAEDLCVMRLWRSPMVLIILALSRILGRHHRLKRLLSYSLAVEFVTLVGTVAMFIFSSSSHH